MRYLVLILTYLFCANAYGQAFKLEYKSPKSLIMLHDQKLTRFDVEIINDANNIPVSTKTQETTRQLSAEQLLEVQRFLLKSGFVNLQSEYGAKEYEKFATYSLEVDWQKIQKKVILREASLNQDPRPQAFAELEKFIIELSQ